MGCLLFFSLLYNQAALSHQLMQQLLAQAEPTQISKQLLLADDLRYKGYNGYSAAMHEGKTEACLMFTDAILASTLPTADIAQVLTSNTTSSPTYSALGSAMHMGKAHTIYNVMSRILESHLSLKEKLDLIAARNGAGLPGLVLAFNKQLFPHHKSLC